MRSTKTILFCITLSFTPVLMIAQKKFILNGKITGQDTGRLVLTYKDANDILIRDTTFLQKGRFSFTGLISEPTHASLRGNVKLRGTEDPEYKGFYLEEGTMTIDLQPQNFKKGVLIGSKTQIELDERDRLTENLEEQSDTLQNRLKALRKKTEQNTIVTDSALTKEIAFIGQELELNRSQRKLIRRIYSYNHPQSFVSPSCLLGQLSQMSTDSIKAIYNHWSPEVQNSRDGKYVANQITRRELTVVGKPAIAFTATDVHGRIIDRSNFKNKKFVLLDFWASWCSYCKKEFPELINMYKKYHQEGLEIIGISLDANKEAWLKAIDETEIDIWTNVLSAKNPLNPSDIDDIHERYNVPSLPTKILIDPKGIIIGIWIEESEENMASLEAKIAEVMKM